MAEGAPGIRLNGDDRRKIDAAATKRAPARQASRSGAQP
jgi:hypothetical protein